MVRTFTDKFAIVPPGGTVNNTEPVTGNKQATMFITRIKRELKNGQNMSREALINAFTSTEFNLILDRHGLLRP
jgi:hypothetical protein